VATRLALSEEDRIARNLLRDWALDAGFTCDVDSMGNMFIRRAEKSACPGHDRFTRGYAGR
jgi:N-carbamoyl-L-amino-acid hydrolase